MHAVIFDMDGVIIDSEPLHLWGDHETFQEFGINPQPGYLDRFVGVTGPVMWKTILADFKLNTDLQALLEKQVHKKIGRLKSTPLSPISGILPLLKTLQKAGIPLGIGSSVPEIFIAAVLETLQLESYFTACVSAETVAKSKPEPDVFLKVAETLQVLPENCTVIEDSRMGVQAAKRAGMRCIGFKNPNSGSQDLSAADSLVTRIADIPLAFLLGSR